MFIVLSSSLTRWDVFVLRKRLAACLAGVLRLLEILLKPTFSDTLESHSTFFLDNVENFLEKVVILHLVYLSFFKRQVSRTQKSTCDIFGTVTQILLPEIVKPFP